MSTASKPLSGFVIEATDILETMGRDLLRLDVSEESDPEVLNGVFRGAHSLKGLAGLFGQDAATELSHHLEDVLDRLRLGRAKRTPRLFDTLNEAVETLQRMVKDASEHAGALAPGTLERAQALGRKLSALAAPVPKSERDPLDRLDLDPNVRAVLTEYEEHRLRESIRKGLLIFRLSVSFKLADFDERLGELNARLKPMAEVLSTLPSSLPGEGDSIGFELLVASGEGEERLQAAGSEFGAELTVLAARKKKATPRRSGQPGLPFWTDEVTASGAKLASEGSAVIRSAVDPASLRSITQTVRVDIERLDELMNSVGELLVIKSSLARLVDRVRQGDASALPEKLVPALSRETRALERRLEELQKGLLAARMVPLAPLFDKLSRLVRKTAREAGKEIEFVTEGGHVELDKLIVEELSDPLMHIIRNALDHGIEAPELRAEKGKPERGRVTLAAWQRGGHVLIEVRDDGAGIHLKRVREVAVQRGILSEVKARELNERELHGLLFLPGFSTAGKVSTLSGRGVGLDVVKVNIAKLSGIIDVDSNADEGTTFRLTLPVTLAILRALVIQVSQRVYAVPLSSVLEIISITPAEIRTVERQQIVTLRGQTLPLVWLAELFGHEPSHAPRPFVVVVGLAQERLGLVVDELLGQQDIVTKPLGGRLKNVRGISGATDIGNRRTVLVLDVGALLEEV